MNKSSLHRQSWETSLKITTKTGPKRLRKGVEVILERTTRLYLAPDAATISAAATVLAKQFC